MARVLIVNSYDGGEMYAEYLRTAGFVVDLATTPEEALSIVEQSAPTVVVSDLVFVGSAIDGPAFIKKIRGRLGSGVRLIALSGFVRQSDEKAAREAGADVFLIKPCPPDTLRRHIEARKRRTRTAHISR